MREEYMTFLLSREDRMAVCSAPGELALVASLLVSDLYRSQGRVQDALRGAPFSRPSRRVVLFPRESRGEPAFTGSGRGALFLGACPPEVRRLWML